MWEPVFRSWLLSVNELNGSAALHRRVLIEHRAKETGDTGGKKRNDNKAQNSRPKLPMTPQIAAVFHKHALSIPFQWSATQW